LLGSRHFSPGFEPGSHDSDDPELAIRLVSLYVADFKADQPAGSRRRTSRSMRRAWGGEAMFRSAAVLGVLLLLGSLGALAAEEGTRHIEGDGVDMFFMNDKVFGTVAGHPLWAIYNCGSDIKGEMDVEGTYHAFTFEYQKEGDRKIVGTFGAKEMSLGEVEKTDDGFIYHVFVGEQEHLFSIRYEKLEHDHMVNSIIEGSLGKGRDLKVTVDGQLCPFATTGIILITAGSSLTS
jgi:hypothetical protein